MQICRGLLFAAASFLLWYVSARYGSALAAWKDAVLVRFDGDSGPVLAGVDDGPAFVVLDLPGRGKGAITSRDIKVGVCVP